MGKSEVVSMSINREDHFFTTVVPTDKIRLELEDEEDEEKNCIRTSPSPSYQCFPHQVAGHVSDGVSLSLLKHDNDTVLKPITNEKNGLKELNFYRHVTNSHDRLLAELGEFIPKFHGNRTVDQIDCIVLEDLTRDFKEPCVMDIKIGRRTWDPNASYDKIIKEEAKYQDCKRDLGFCIPGFQVYQINNTKVTLNKFDKSYGKTLNKDTVPQALRTFLNSSDSAKPICRALLVQLLASLWRIQLWFRKNRWYKFYSSSLLLVYDARRLRDLNSVADNNNQVIESDKVPALPRLKRSTSLYRPLSLAVLPNSDKIPTGFSGLFTNQGPNLSRTLYKSATAPKSSVANTNNSINTNVWQKSIRSLKRTHSFQNNYDEDMQSKIQDYTSILDELSCENQKPEQWAMVKMIDFAHAFPSDKHELDVNYLEGIDNLVRIFEAFLTDSE